MESGNSQNKPLPGDAAPTALDHEIPAAKLRAAFNAIVLKALPSAVAWLSVFYAIFAITHGFFLPADTTHLICLMAAITAGTLLAIYMGLKLRPLPARWAHPLAAGVAGIMLVNGLTYLHVAADLTFIILLIMGAGFYLLSSRCFALFLGLALLGTGGLLWLTRPGLNIRHVGLTLFMATGFSIFVHMVRTQTLQRLEKLRFRDQWLAKFPDENPYPVLRVLRDGTIVYSNRPGIALLDFWGVQTGDPLPERWQAFIADIFESGASKDLEVELDNRMLFLKFTLAVGIDCVNIYGLDITEHRRAEAALRKSQELLALMFEQSLDGFFFMMLDEPVHWNAEVNKADVLDYVFTHQRITKINDAMLAQYGARQEQFMGLTPSDFYAHDPAYGKQVWHKFFDEGRLHIETYERKFNGTPVWIEGDYICLYDEQGRITGHFGVQRDVTEHKNAQEALQDSEKRLRMMLEAAPEGIIIVDGSGHMILVNASTERMFGYSREEMLGQPIGLLVPEKVRHAHTKYCESYISDPHVRPMGIGLDLTARRKDGSQFPAEISLGFVETKEEILATSFILDISKRKAVEAQREQLLKELESVNRELKDFAYIVSHDLKAPLRAISSLADWLATDYKDRLDEDGQELLQLLLARVKRMHNLIEGVLQYSRVGRVREETVTVDLNKLLADIIDLLAPPPNIEIYVAPDLPAIDCERTRIAQVFQNLLSNAVKYMDKPAGEIRVACRDAGAFWEFSVADNGPGIEARYFEKIFQLFQTLQPRDEFESTGVGLAVVKKIIELYGGRIWVESEVGEGSTFFFTLPK